MTDIPPFDPAKYEAQRAASRAEAERLKALWAVENSVDKAARREKAAREAAEKEARETPSAEDQVLGVEYFSAVYLHGWSPPHRHRLLLDGDDEGVLKHVFTMWIRHPFRKSAWEHVITLPADKFHDRDWCTRVIEIEVTRQWASLLEQEAADQRHHVRVLMRQMDD